MSMKPLNLEETKAAVKSGICPNYLKEPSTKDWDVIKVNENLMYCKCNFCNSALNSKEENLVIIGILLDGSILLEIKREYILEFAAIL